MEATPGARRWSTRKKDTAPRGVRRHPSGVWAIRFTCGAGCLHKERVGPLKQDAVRVYHQRRARAQAEPGWCPRVERHEERARAQADRARAARRITVHAYAEEYLAWAKLHHRGWATEASRIAMLQAAFGDRLMLDDLSAVEVERFLDGLLAKRSQSTRNRYRTLLHAMLNRAVRHGLIPGNPVRGVGKFKEPEGRTLYLTPADEAAVQAAVRPELRALFAVSVHTGLRWSEQRALQWGDVDFLTGLITVRQSKSGHARQVPMNSLVRSVVMDLANARQRPNDPEEVVFTCPHAQADKFFPRAVAQAQATLRGLGQDAGRLEGYTWHCNRHTFASRLVMAGVDLRSVQQLGGWRTLAMVQRYSHLAPAHLQAAVERLVPPSSVAMELSRNCPDAAATTAGVS